MEFDREGVSREVTVEALLEAPCCVLGVPIESDPHMTVAEDVVDGTETVEGPTGCQSSIG